MRIKIISHLAYDIDVIFPLLLNFVWIITMTSIWKYVYAQNPDIHGVSLPQMQTYAIVSTLVGCFCRHEVQEELYYRMRQGTIAIDFIRPMNLVVSWLFEDIGNMVNNLLKNFVPILLFAVIFIQVPLPQNLSIIPLFVLSVLLCALLLWLISLFFGLLTVVWVDFGNLGVIRDPLLKIMAGSFVPLWFFPGWFRKVSDWLPFKYTYQTPLSIYIGKLSMTGSLAAVGIQAVWITVLCVCMYLFWQKVKKRLLIQGG